jgi:hypothetical protein
MTSIRGVSGPSGPAPAEAVDAAKTAETRQTREPTQASNGGDVEAARLEALQAFFAGSSVPVDIPALAQALMQEGAITG